MINSVGGKRTSNNNEGSSECDWEREKPKTFEPTMCIYSDVLQTLKKILMTRLFNSIYNSGYILYQRIVKANVHDLKSPEGDIVVITDWLAEWAIFLRIIHDRAYHKIGKHTILGRNNLDAGIHCRLERLCSVLRF